jgi:hypothetical protein
MNYLNCTYRKKNIYALQCMKTAGLHGMRGGVDESSEVFFRKKSYFHMEYVDGASIHRVSLFPLENQQSRSTLHTVQTPAQDYSIPA